MGVFSGKCPSIYCNLPWKSSSNAINANVGIRTLMKKYFILSSKFLKNLSYTATQTCLIYIHNLLIM